MKAEFFRWATADETVVHTGKCSRCRRRVRVDVIWMVQYGRTPSTWYRHLQRPLTPGVWLRMRDDAPLIECPTEGCAAHVTLHEVKAEYIADRQCGRQCAFSASAKCRCSCAGAEHGRHHLYVPPTEETTR